MTHPIVTAHAADPKPATAKAGKAAEITSSHSQSTKEDTVGFDQIMQIAAEHDTATDTPSALTNDTHSDVERTKQVSPDLGLAANQPEAIDPVNAETGPTKGQATVVAEEAKKKVTIPDLPSKQSNVAPGSLATESETRVSHTRPGETEHQAANFQSKNPATQSVVAGDKTTAETDGKQQFAVTSNSIRSAEIDASKLGQTERNLPKASAPPNHKDGAFSVDGSSVTKSMNASAMDLEFRDSIGKAREGDPVGIRPSDSPRTADQTPGLGATVTSNTQHSIPSKPLKHVVKSVEDRSFRAPTSYDTNETVAPQTNHQPNASQAAKLNMQTPSVLQAMVASTPLAQTQMKDAKIESLHQDGELESIQFDLRGAQSSSSTQSTTQVAAMNRSDLPRAIAMQIADAARATPDRPVDVSLNPDELGRVRLSVSATEAGVVLSVLAERPETLDLMRRHAEQLARDLAGMGFDSVELSFGKGQDGATGEKSNQEQNSEKHSSADPIGQDPADLDEQLSMPISLDPGKRLDIRI